MDDFFDEDDNKDFLIELRSTERHLNDVKTSGFRDATQEFMENESLIQSGFDSSYKIFVKLAFRIGEIRALSSNLCKNSCFLAKLNDKLDKIENFDYDSRIHWSFDLNNVVPDYSQVIELVNYFTSNLNDLKEILSNFSSENLVEKLDDNLNKFKIKIESEDDLLDETDSQNVNLLNNLLENWNF
ncbi:unnamed protein product [Brachionus calyciflorus]|uniref:Uncharacterized protein n=1 Tax=Brachionus calyciflorus TaxID=104777 RepID=A0A814S1V3_9BILA|nr:unnamed protein product [Brachionus calyciflorus]